MSALLTGKALDVYTRLSQEDATNYDKLKLALLRRYNFNEHGYASALGRQDLKSRKALDSSLCA